MKKLGLMACVAFAVLAATPAQADFVVVRFKDGMCRIAGGAAGLPPLPRKSVVLVGRFDTWLEALAAMNGLHTQQQCRWVSLFAS
jgi:hypothetical protein